MLWAEGERKRGRDRKKKRERDKEGETGRDAGTERQGETRTSLSPRAEGCLKPAPPLDLHVARISTRFLFSSQVELGFCHL